MGTEIPPPSNKATLVVTQQEMNRLPSIANHFVDRILITSEDGREVAVYKDRADGQPKVPYLEVTVRVPIEGEPGTPSWPDERDVDQQALELYVDPDGALTDHGYDALMDCVQLGGYASARVVRPAALEWPAFDFPEGCEACGEAITDHDHARLAQIKYRQTLCKRCYFNRRDMAQEVG